MLGELIRTVTEDQIQLVGLLYEPQLKAGHQLVIHVHGTCGNFYENPFLDHLAWFYPAKGFSLLTVNTRGHDANGINERFDDCLLDLKAWMKFAWTRSYERVLLQGHSLGASKVTRVASDLEFLLPKVVGLVLLSPVDIVAQYSGGTPDSRGERVAAARALAEIDPSRLVPASVWDQYPISAGTYVDLMGPETHADVFPFRKGSLADSGLARLDLPVLAFVGGQDPVMYPSPPECCRQLSALPHVEAVCVESAPHNFAGHESVVLDTLSTWLEGVPGLVAADRLEWRG